VSFLLFTLLLSIWNARDIPLDKLDVLM
jgi:hypothetical protein